MTSEEMAEMTPDELVDYMHTCLDEARRAYDMASVKVMARLNGMS